MGRVVCVLVVLGMPLPAFGASPDRQLVVDLGVNKDLKIETLKAVVSAIRKSKGAAPDLTLRIQKAKGISARIQAPPRLPYRDLARLLDVLKKAGVQPIAVGRGR